MLIHFKCFFIGLEDNIRPSFFILKDANKAVFNVSLFVLILDKLAELYWDWYLILILFCVYVFYVEHVWLVFFCVLVDLCHHVFRKLGVCVQLLRDKWENDLVVLLFYALLDVLVVQLVLYDSTCLLYVAYVEESTSIIQSFLGVFNGGNYNFIYLDQIGKKWLDYFGDLGLQIFLVEILLFYFCFLELG
jgi:hypothetical protein